MNKIAIQPWVMEAKEAHRSGRVQYTDEGDALVVVAEGATPFRVSISEQFDLTQATLFGLNERLTLAATSPVMEESGRTLRDLFQDEWLRYNTFDYGWYAYYPRRNHLVRYAPPFWHRVVSVASSSKLLQDPLGRLSWWEIRQLFEQTSIAVAGCSVGSSVAHAAVMDLRPKRITLADKSLYKMENINRVRLRYDDIVESNAGRGNQFALPLRNKAEATAEQLFAIDPFLDIALFADGVHEENVDQFLSGVDVLVEEVDDPKIKLLLRSAARRLKIPVIMVTDAGSAVQLDILRYDKNDHLSFSFGTDDTTLTNAMERVYDDPGNRAAFFSFVDALIGVDYRSGELEKILQGKTEIPTSTIIPQLGSTAAMAGAVGAEAIARIRLGWDYPSRVFINKHTFDVKIYP